MNKDPHPQLLLRRDEKYSALLQPYVKTHMADIPNDDKGRTVCLWYHCDGECTTDCLFRDTHCLLVPATVNKCCSFLAKASKEMAEDK